MNKSLIREYADHVKKGMKELVAKQKKEQKEMKENYFSLGKELGLSGSEILTAIIMVANEAKAEYEESWSVK